MVTQCPLQTYLIPIKISIEGAIYPSVHVHVTYATGLAHILVWVQNALAVYTRESRHGIYRIPVTL